MILVVRNIIIEINVFISAKLKQRYQCLPWKVHSVIKSHQVTP